VDGDDDDSDEGNVDDDSVEGTDNDYNNLTSGWL